MIQAKLVVGAADDRYEREADTVAATVVDSLAGEQGGRHLEQVPSESRISRMARTPVAGLAVTSPRTRISRLSEPVGMAGGDIDAQTERAIESARSSGRPLGGKVRRRMEAAIGADFGGVRVHVGAQSDALNEQLSAKAFTSGSDVFVRSADYRPDTPEGTKLLAHELTHTVQQGASPTVARTFDPATGAIAQSVQRTTRVVQRWEWWDKRQAAKKKAAEDAAKKQQENAPAPNDKFQGRAGQLKNSAVEIAKPTGTIAAAAGTGIGVAAGVGKDFAGGAGGMVLSPLLMGDAAMGLNAAREMSNEGQKFGDTGMSKLAGRKGKDQGQALAAAAIGTTKAGVDIANAAQGTVSQLGHVALGAASGGLGIAAGSAMVLQGAWRGGQAVMKLCRLTWGRGQEMLTPEGERWKAAVVSAEKFKVATNALKMAVGALGIAAGALLIVSNPIGWAVGIAAGIAGGIYAISKIVARVSNAKDKEKVRDQIEAGVPAERIMPSEAAAPAKRTKEERGSGFKKGDQAPVSDEGKKRQAAIDKANEVSRLASANARVADEMRKALAKGDKDLVFKAIEIFALQPTDVPSVGPFAGVVTDDLYEMIKRGEDRRLHDAFQILSSINVDPDQALSPSGQDLIEQKLSKAESM